MKRLKDKGFAADSGFNTSKEKLVLGFITWNGGTAIIGSGISSAMQRGDRATAWFEIRYNSNGGDSRKPFGAGIAKGRFFQSQIFGLYDDPANVSSKEAESIYRMLQANRAKIIKEESLFGKWSDGGRRPNTEEVKGGNIDRIATANTDYKDALSYVQNGKVQYIDDVLNPAKEALLESLGKKSEFAEDFSDWFGESNLISTNIYMAHPTDGGVINASKYEEYAFKDGVSDLMIGGEGKDTLHGGKGNVICPR